MPGRNAIEVFRVEVGAGDQEFKRVAAQIDRVQQDLELKILQRELQIKEAQDRIDNARLASAKVAAQRRLNFITYALEAEKQKLTEVYQAQIRLQRAAEESARIAAARMTIAAGENLPPSQTGYRRGAAGQPIDEVRLKEILQTQSQVFEAVKAGQAAIMDLEARAAEQYERFEKAKTYSAKKEAFNRLQALREELSLQMRAVAAAEGERMRLMQLQSAADRARGAIVPVSRPGEVQIVRTVPPGAINVTPGAQLGPRIYPFAQNPNYFPPTLGPYTGSGGQRPPTMFPFPPGPPGPPGGGGINIPPGIQNFFAQMVGAQLVAYAIRGAIMGWVSNMKEAIGEGLKLNALFELMKIGVAATLAQNVKVFDAQGKQLEGLKAVIAAQGESEAAQKKIVQAAIESGAGLDEFLEAFRIALPLALQMGASVEDTIDVTKRLVLAATAIGVPFDLVRLQIDDIMRGVVTTRTTLARVLGLTQDILRPARENGTIVDLIRQKTQAFLEAQEQIAGTYQLQLNRMKLLGQLVIKEATSGGFDVLKRVMAEILKQFIDVDKATGEFKFSSDALEIIKSMREAVTALFEAVRDQAPAMIQVLSGVLVWLGRLMAGLGYATTLIRGLKGNADEGEIKSFQALLDEVQSKIEEMQKKGQKTVGFPSVFSGMTLESLKTLRDTYAQHIEQLKTADRQREEGAQSALRFGEAIEKLADETDKFGGKLDKAAVSAAAAKKATGEMTLKQAIDFQDLEKSVTEALDKARATAGRSLNLEESEAVTAKVVAAAGLDPASFRVRAEQAVQAIAKDVAEARSKLSVLMQARNTLDSNLLKQDPESQLKRVQYLMSMAGLPAPSDLVKASAEVDKAVGALKLRTQKLRTEPILAPKETQTVIAEQKEKLDTQLLGIKTRQVDVETKLAEVEFKGVQTTFAAFETSKSQLQVRLAELKVEEARAAVASRAELIEKIKGGTIGAAQRAELARDQASLRQAEGQLKIAKMRADHDLASGKAEDERVAANKKAYEIELKRLSVRSQLLEVELQEGKVDSGLIASQRQALLELDASLELEKEKADLRASEARLDAARKSQNVKSVVDAEKEVEASANKVAEAEQKVYETRQKGVRALREANEASRDRADKREAERLATDAAERVVSADRQVLAAEENLTSVKARSLITDQVARQVAENQLALARAALKVEQARAALLEAQLAARQAFIKLVADEASLGAGSDQVKQDEEDFRKALLGVDNAKLGVDRAIAEVTGTIVDNYDAMTTAIKNQISEGGKLFSLFSDLSNIASQFGFSLPKGLSQFFAGVKSIFSGLGNMTQAIRDALKGTSNQKVGESITGPASAIGAIFGSGGIGIKGLFKGGAMKGIGGLLGLFGGLMSAGGAISGLVGGMRSGGPVGGALSGGLLGGAVATAIPLLMGNTMAASLAAAFTGPIGLAIIGGTMLLGGLLGASRKKTKKISADIQKKISETMKSFNVGDIGIGTTIKQLEQQRAEAVSRLSGRRKGGKDELKKITDDIDQKLQELKNRQKQVFDAFEAELKVLRAPDALRDVANSIENINQKLKAFLDAGGDAAQAAEYLNLSLAKLGRGTQADLNQEELDTIDLLEKEIDLQKQKDDVIKKAKDAEAQVRQRMGLTRVMTPAQTAAQEIKKIKDDEAEQLKKIDREMRLNEAELEGRKELFNLQMDENALLEERLRLQRLDTAEIVTKIRLLQDFLRDNAAAFAAAFSQQVGVGLTVPQLNGANLTQGGVVFSIGQVVVQAHPGMTPEGAWRSFRAGLNYGMGINVDGTYYARRMSEQ